MSVSAAKPPTQLRLPLSLTSDEAQWLSLERVAGVDEVGRGALFGPVVAAAVMLPWPLPPALLSAGIRDSKALSAQKRVAIAAQIRALAVDCQIGLASAREIDRLNILQASLLAMQRAILRLTPAPTLCLIDGNQRVPGLLLPQQTWIKGDQRSLAIAAASIVAKVWRDELMTRLSDRYPQYHLAQNKGYGSAAHRQSLADYGASAHHRQSFKPCQDVHLAARIVRLD